MLFLGSVVKGKGRPVTLRDISHVPSGLKTSRALSVQNHFSGVSYLLLRPHLFRVPLRSSGLSAWRPFRCLPPRGKASREARARSASREIVILGLEAKASQQSLARRLLRGPPRCQGALRPGPGWGRGWGRSRSRGRGWLQPCPAGRRASGGRRCPVRHGEDVNFSTSRCLM